MTMTSKQATSATAGGMMPVGAMTIAATDTMPQPSMNAAYTTEERQEMPAGAMAITASGDMPMGGMDSVAVSPGADMPGGGMGDAGSDMPPGAMHVAAGAGESWQMDVADGHPCGCN